MMTGTVNAALEASLRLRVEDTHGQVQEVEAILDTAFNGFLTLPWPLPDLQYHAADVVVSCLIDVLSLAIVAILFSIHAEASGRDMEPMEPFGGAEFEPPFIAPTAAPPEDGNPYRPPSAQ